ncbi:unnamed protein product [Owenia fusiformis]|uniref:Uncharacterized protein n=1 Tax=Owenia fusiformis TaxID=6347 RepID=A0A8J1XH33_OWEFU|nr:unnamed protein product [Owenia fusiformis]
METTTFMLWVFLGLNALIDTVLSCSCMPAHPQEHFCNADFVIKAKFKGKKLLYSKNINEVEGHNITHRFPTEIMYHTRISKVYKETEAYNGVSHTSLYTAAEGAACGVTDLKEQTKYLISGNVVGGKARTGTCEWVQEWNKVHVRYRKGVQFIMEKHCDCKVVPCFDKETCDKLNKEYKKGKENQCAWPFLDDPTNCYSTYAMCQKRKEGGCQWTRPKAWRTCLQKAKEDRLKEP